MKIQRSASVFGWVISWACALPALAQVRHHGGSSSAGADDGILYVVRGGYVAADNRLEIDAAGRASATLSNSIQGTRAVSLQLSAREHQLLLALFRAADFDAMPARFVPEGDVADGAQMLVTWKHDGSAHEVASETAAIESAGFAQIREQLDGIVADMLDQIILRVTADGGFIGAHQTLEVKASGAWSFRMEWSGGSAAANGVLPAAQLERLYRAVDADDYMSMPTCATGASHPDAIRYEMTVARDGASHTVRFDDGTAGEIEVFGIVSEGIARLSQRVGR